MGCGLKPARIKGIQIQHRNPGEQGSCHHPPSQSTRRVGAPRRDWSRGLPKIWPVDLHNIMCKTLHMATNLALDDKLIEEAQRSGKHKTKKEAVTAALEEYIRRRKQLRILDAFGSFDFDPDYDYKAERRKRRS
jgi:Arc/MetJ family transcription regulator